MIQNKIIPQYYSKSNSPSYETCSGNSDMHPKDVEVGLSDTDSDEETDIFLQLKHHKDKNQNLFGKLPGTDLPRNGFIWVSFFTKSMNEILKDSFVY